MKIVFRYNTVMERKTLVKYILIIQIFFVTLYGNNFNEIVINENQKVTNNFKFYYFDTIEDLSIEEVANSNFVKEMSNNFSLGYVKGDLWIKLNIKNNSKKTKLILTVNEHFYEKFNLYFFEEKWIKKENSLFLPIEKREIKTNKLSFSINLKENQSQTYYLQLKGKYAYFGKISLYENDEFYLKEQIHTNTFFSFVFGVFFLIFIFTLFLFLKIKEKTYFFYFGYSFFYLIYMINISGVLAYFNLQEYVYKLHSAGAFTIVFFALFSMEYLKLKKHFKTFSYVLYFLVLVLLICGTYTIFQYTPWNKIVNNTVGIVNILLILSAVFMYFKGYAYTKYYILIMVSFFTFVFLFTTMVSGKVEYNLVTRYGYIVASTLELLFFTLLLVDKFAVSKNKHIKYQESLLELKENQEQLLKEEVEKRTLELTESNKKLSILANEKHLLLKEVFHRVKNNFHMILAMLWFESNKHENKDLFTELSNRIKSMSKLHEHLIYSSNDLENISSDKYLKSILENILSSYSQKSFDLQYKIADRNLSFNEALSLGIIINEIISNSIKHNKKEIKNKIEVVFSNRNNTSELYIKDSGVDFPKDYKKGFGLTLVDEFANKLKNATYTFSYEEGISFALSFKNRDDNDK